VAERILTLGHAPEHNYSAYAQNASIKESKKISDGVEAVSQVLESFQTVLILQREILNLAAGAGDEGTNALMSDYIRLQEKMVWMYSAFLKK
jgi:starvation-inducible DNA-binding protein